MTQSFHWFALLTRSNFEQIVFDQVTRKKIAAFLPKTIETRTGIILDKACWTMGLEFKESDLDRGIAFMITLKGIGEVSIQ